MKLSDTLQADQIRIPLRSTTKEDVLRELVELLPAARNEADAERLLDAVLEREKRMSTGIGQGVAIPHGKCDLVADMQVAFGVAASSIEYEALDGDPCDVFFLLVSPPAMTGPHISALAQISRMLSSDSVRGELAAAAGPEEVLTLFRREESLASD